MNRFKRCRTKVKPVARLAERPRHRRVTPAAILLAANALQQRQAGKPTLYYILMDKVPDKDCAYQLPDSRAAVGFDLTFHPDLLPTIIKQMEGQYTLRPLDAQEVRRRGAGSGGVTHATLLPQEHRRRDRGNPVQWPVRR